MVGALAVPPPGNVGGIRGFQSIFARVDLAHCVAYSSHPHIQSSVPGARYLGSTAASLPVRLQASQTSCKLNTPSCRGRFYLLFSVGILLGHRELRADVPLPLKPLDIGPNLRNSTSLHHGLHPLVRAIKQEQLPSMLQAHKRWCEVEPTARSALRRERTYTTRGVGTGAEETYNNAPGRSYLVSKNSHSERSRLTGCKLLTLKCQHFAMVGVLTAPPES